MSHPEFSDDSKKEEPLVNLGVTTHPKQEVLMFSKIAKRKGTRKQSTGGGDWLLFQAGVYLKGILSVLDEKIDKRLVRNFHDLFVALLIHRNRASSLLLSELGKYICGPSKAPAGTKRISNLLRSKKWSSTDICSFLLKRSIERMNKIAASGRNPLLLWDDSRIEKPEACLLEGLCSVWSSKGKRLTKVKRGFYRPPVSRICVPGYHWTAAMVSCLGDIPQVCSMKWWTSRGRHKEQSDNISFRMLRDIAQQAPSNLLHVMDRGYASAKILDWMKHFQQHFLIRWKTNILLQHAEKGTKKTHLLARSFKAKNAHKVYDKERKQYKTVTFAWATVYHPEFPDWPLTLLIVRDKSSYSSPLYLLTSLEINNKKKALELLRSYMHRWEVEQAFRFCKSEMGIESARLWFWENRLKLMGIVALAYDFLLSQIKKGKLWVECFLQHWDHRTGNRYRQASIPIYRLRQAISICLIFIWAQNSG